jgi:hypothetical protein
VFSAPAGSAVMQLNAIAADTAAAARRFENTPVLKP